MKYNSVIIPKLTLVTCVAASLSAWLPGSAAAKDSDEMWGLCHSATPPAPTASGDILSPDQYPTYLNSDYGEGTLDELYTLIGHVSIKRGPQQMEADQAVYDSQTGTVNAEGNVRFQQGGLITQGTSARFNLDAGTGEVSAARYEFSQRHASGHAATIIHESAEITHLRHATYTTCNPNQLDWELRARTVTLNHSEAVGEAYNVSLRFKNVPFFYFPYINFPLNDARKTGLLPPILGYSNTAGFDIGVPIYWNIAPNRDATITPRLIEHRGLLAKGEFRYLTEASQGEIQAEYLPNDRKFGADRGTLAYQHRTQFTPHWNTSLNANYISDDRYLADLGNSLASASTTYVERRLDLNYNGDYANFLTRLQGYQTLDPTLPAASRPYQRLPQLVLTAAPPPQPFAASYRLDSEYVRFERADSLTGTRLSVTPSLAWPLESQSYFFRPKIALNHTQYQLDNQTAAEADPARTAPLYSIDSGLFFERDATLGARTFLQTLEPRLYYLRVPYRDQTSLPLFDTSAFDFSVAQLFQENRFSGSDRLGDANQVSVAVTSRLIDQTSGREWLSGSLGEIFYMADRRVTLSGPPETRNASDIVAEAATRLSERWSTTLNLQWNPDIDKVDQGAFQFRYHADERRLFNAGYRFLRDQLTQTDLSFLWLLDPRWQLLGRWNYSLRDHHALETLAGIQYESCCWIFRATSRRYVSDVAGDNNRSLYLQLELKGLANIGQSAEAVLERGILGYRPGH